MSYDGLFLILSVLVLSTFVVIAYFWFQANSNEFTVNNTIKGYYPPAQLNQRCSVIGETGPSVLLPGYFTPQECGYNLTCVLNVPTDAYGICKSKYTGICNNIYDCAPSGDGSPIYCVGGVCTNTLLGGLFSTCGTTGPVQCDASLGLKCTNTTCLYQDGIICTGNNQCIGGYCLPNSPSGPTGVCISRIPGGDVCNVDFCADGFFCNGGVCQPNGTTLGGTGSFCSIPYITNGKPTFNCNSGLICNFDPNTNTSELYPGVTGYGVCNIPSVEITRHCYTGTEACIPTGVCRDNYCQAPLDNTNTPNINWCGIESSGLCSTGYQCDTNSYYCKPTLGNLCNSGNGSCVAGSVCSDFKLGVYLPSSDSQIVNTWSTFDLPSGLSVGNNSCLSLNQVSSIKIDYTPYILTQILYYEPLRSYFYYGIMETNSDNITSAPTWNKIDFINENALSPFTNSNQYTILGFKFTKNGTFTLLLKTTSLYTVRPNTPLIIIFPNALDLNAKTFDLGNPFTLRYFLPYSGSSIIVKNWDVDDVYNNNVLTFFTVSNNVKFFYATIDYGVSQKFLTEFSAGGGTSFISPPVWINSMVIPGNPSVYSFITNGIKGTDTKQTIYTNNSGVLNLTNFYTLEQNVVNGVASSFNLLNNFYDHQYYYISNTQFNYVNFTSVQTLNADKTALIYKAFETPVNGYAPTFMTTSNSSNALTFGNLDEKLYTIVSICQ